MKEEVIFRMESAYREDFEVKSYHFGGPEKTMCIIGNMRGNEIQQLYIAGQMVRTLKRFEEEGRFIRRHGVTVIPCANPYSVNVGKRFWAMDNSDINRMYPGYNKGETTQRIAAGIFEKIQGYRFGVPPKARYEELFNTDEERWGGSGVTNPQPIKTECIPSHQQAQSIAVRVPPLGAVILQGKGKLIKPLDGRE